MENRHILQNIEAPRNPPITPWAADLRGDSYLKKEQDSCSTDGEVIALKRPSAHKKSMMHAPSTMFCFILISIFLR